MVFKKKILEKTGELFDRDLFNYMEEIDFCWRVMRSGFKVMAVPKSVVFHKVASTSKKTPIKKRYWEHRNNLLLLFKNLSTQDLKNVAAPRIAFEIVTYTYYLLTLNFRYCISLFLAHLDFFYRLPTFAQKRSKPYRLLSTYPIFNGSISVSHFIRRVQLFSGLGHS